MGALNGDLCAELPFILMHPKVMPKKKKLFKYIERNMNFIFFLFPSLLSFNCRDSLHFVRVNPWMEKLMIVKFSQINNYKEILPLNYMNIIVKE